MPAVGILKRAFSRDRPALPPPPPPTLSTPSSSERNPKDAPAKPPRSPALMDQESNFESGNTSLEDDGTPEAIFEKPSDYTDITQASETLDSEVPKPPYPKAARQVPPPPSRTPPNGTEATVFRTEEELVPQGEYVDVGYRVISDAGLADDCTPDSAVEEPYNYSHIDQSSKILDSEVPKVPHPKPLRQAPPLPPRTVLNGDGITVFRAEEEVVPQDACIEVGYRVVSDEDLAKDDEEVDEGQPTALESKLKGVAGQNLARFLLDHEGKELSMDEVAQLEVLLNETDKAEEAAGLDREEDANWPRPAETLDVLEDIDGPEVDRNEHSDEEPGVMIGRIPLFNSMDDFREGDRRSLPNDFYRMLIPRDMRYSRPDLSSYVRPEPSTSIGDPFAWRRRGKRRYDTYSYEPLDSSLRKVPSIHKILDGCQEVEDMLVARDLGPPGALARKYDVIEHRNVTKSTSLPALYRHNLPSRYHHSLPPIAATATTAAEEGFVAQLLTNGNHAGIAGDSVSVPEDDVHDLDVLASIESEIMVNPEDDIGKTVLLEDPSVDQSRDGAEEAEKVVGDVIVPERSAFRTGDDVETAASVIAKCTEQVDDAGADDIDNRSMVDESAEHEHKLLDRNRSPPSRPVRFKRVSSAEALLTPLGVQQQQQMPQSDVRCQKAPLSKRSISFHTADDIRRRIDIQAQRFLRTPRRKDRASSTYSLNSSSVSSALTYESFMRRPRLPARPYSSVGRDLTYTRDASMQTGANHDTDTANGTEYLSPDPRYMYGSGSVSSLENIVSAVKERGKAEVVSAPAIARDSKIDKRSAYDFLVEDSAVPEEFFNSKNPEPAVVETEVPDLVAVSELSAFVSVGIGAPSPLSPESTSSAPQQLMKTDLDESDVVVTVGTSYDAPPASASPTDRSLPINTPIIFCGILPKDEDDGSRKMMVVPEMRVLRLYVSQLDASVIRVSHLEHLLELPTSSASLPPMQPSDDGADKPPSSNGDVSYLMSRNRDGLPRESAEDQARTDERTPDPLKGKNTNSDERTDWPSDDVVTTRLAGPVLQRDYGMSSTDDGRDNLREGVPVVRTVPQGRPAKRDPLLAHMDERYSAGRLCYGGRPPAMTGSTTSDSASYVTCDETLHDDLDQDDDRLLDFSIDGDDGVSLDDYDHEAAAGSRTPTQQK